MYYFVVNYGVDGWKFSSPFKTPQEALKLLRAGDNWGQEWKIVKELDIQVIDENLNNK